MVAADANLGGQVTKMTQQRRDSRHQNNVIARAYVLAPIYPHMLDVSQGYKYVNLSVSIHATTTYTIRIAEKIPLLQIFTLCAR